MIRGSPTTNLFPPLWMKRSPRAKGNNQNNSSEDNEEAIATAELETPDFTTRSNIISEPLLTIHLAAENEVSSPYPLTDTGSPLRAIVASGAADQDEDISASTGAVVATPINSDLVDWNDNSLDLDDPFSSSNLMQADDSNERGAYVSATAFHCDGTGIGLSIRSIQGRLRISAIQRGSVFSDGPLRVGDNLVSINGYSCNPIIDGGQATRILNNLKGTVAVVASTKGDAGLIECMIIKPSAGCHTGLGLQYLEGRLQILTLDKEGLWSHSLLNEGNYVLSINGLHCSQMDGPTAAALVNSSESAVTIKSQAQQECVVVIEEGPRNCRDSGPRKRSCAYYSPCFRSINTPAKTAVIAANVFALVLCCGACWFAEVGIPMSLVAIGFSLLIINIPWIGWIDRPSSHWCSVGQVTGTLLVLIMCTVVMPFYSGAGLTKAVGPGIAIPLAVIVNLPMHFSDDNIEQYILRDNTELLSSESSEVCSNSTTTQRQTQSRDQEVGTNPDS